LADSTDRNLIHGRGFARGFLTKAKILAQSSAEAAEGMKRKGAGGAKSQEKRGQKKRGREEIETTDDTDGIKSRSGLGVKLQSAKLTKMQAGSGVPLGAPGHDVFWKPVTNCDLKASASSLACQFV
jgi:hypothetical protein